MQLSRPLSRLSRECTNVAPPGICSFSTAKGSDPGSKGFISQKGQGELKAEDKKTR